MERMVFTTAIGRCRRRSCQKPTDGSGARWIRLLARSWCYRLSGCLIEREDTRSHQWTITWKNGKQCSV